MNDNHLQQPKILDCFSEVHITSSFLLLIPWIFFFFFPNLLFVLYMHDCMLGMLWLTKPVSCCFTGLRLLSWYSEIFLWHRLPTSSCAVFPYTDHWLFSYAVPTQRSPSGRQIIHNFLPSLGPSNPPMTPNIPIHILIVTPYEMRCLNPCTIFDAI